MIIHIIGTPGGDAYPISLDSTAELYLFKAKMQVRREEAATELDKMIYDNILKTLYFYQNSEDWQQELELGEVIENDA